LHHPYGSENTGKMAPANLVRMTIGESLSS
jgi:hypothetical protein